MNPINIEISKKIDEKNLIESEISMFDKVVSQTKWHIVAYSIFVASIAIYFIFTLFTRVKVAVPFTAVIAIYLLIVAVAGILTVYFDNEKYYRYHAYFTLVNILINLIFLVIAVYTLIPPEDVRKTILKHVTTYDESRGNVELDELQLSLKCCGHTSAIEYHKGKKPKYLIKLLADRETLRLAEKSKDQKNIEEPKQEEEDQYEYQIPLTCCEDVDRHRRCTKELSYKQGCWAAYKEKLGRYRVRSLVLIILSVVLQVLFIVAYSYKVKKSEST